MDKRELLLATLQGEKTERIPCGFWYHFDDSCKYGQAAIQAHVDFYEKIDADILKVMNEYSYRIDREIKNPRDWRAVRPSSFSDSPYTGYLDEFKALKKALPSEVPLFATVHGVLVSAYHATEKPGNFSNPDNMVSRHLKQDPESVAVGLQAIAQTLIALCEHLVEAGADGIYYAALGGEAYRFERSLFESYVKPFDKQVIEAINGMGAKSILHICKDQIVLPMYQGIPADIINWDIHDCPYSLSDGRALFPGKTLLGGFDDRSGELVDGSLASIEQAVEDMVAVAGRERFIIGSDCTLPTDVEPWRLNAAKKQASLY
ncbi:uroporphyrinogen decarboxylase family protein [uncultured Sphaerochaeta sp.]|uniref:uroporphyrinogen decarboxylase family protein n=1 Tax=uncultured Sphaerochaeta sp. TaxID=886478 RepID=UPI002A0A7604|nr:uroporphyrinogen decarboxylase family protein [uncultured Sphaerochaeta sp.]